MKDKHIEFSPHDTAEFLRTPEEISDFLEAIFENYGDEPRTIIKALGTVARAQGMQGIADATGLQRQGLYKSLSEDGNPSFETVLKVMNAVGVELRPVVSVRREIQRALDKMIEESEARPPLRGRPANDTAGPSRKNQKRA